MQTLAVLFCGWRFIHYKLVMIGGMMKWLGRTCSSGRHWLCFTAILLLGSAGCSCAEDHPPSSKLHSPPPLDQETITRQRQQDQHALEELRRRGIDLSKPHRVKHYFICASRVEGLFLQHSDSRAHAESIISWGAENGYEATRVSRSDQGTTEFTEFQLVTTVVPELENMVHESTTMLKVAAENEAEYNGWEIEPLE